MSKTFNTFLFSTFALLAVSSNAVSVCADAQPDELPAAPYCPPFEVSSEQQRLILDRFVQGFFITGKPRQALVDHVWDNYIQHNPDILSGKAAILSLFDGNTSDFGITYPTNIISRAFDEETQIGVIHHYFTPAAGTQPSVTVDIFRMNGSCIMEHWDVIQDRPANATNPLAMF